MARIFLVGLIVAHGVVSVFIYIQPRSRDGDAPAKQNAKHSLEETLGREKTKKYVTDMCHSTLVPRSFPAAAVALCRHLPVNGYVHTEQSLKAETESLTAWICRQLSTGRGRSQGVRGAVQALCVLLRDDDARIMFTRHGGVGSLTKILRMQVCCGRVRTGHFDVGRRR